MRRAEGCGPDGEAAGMFLELEGVELAGRAVLRTGGVLVDGQ